MIVFSLSIVYTLLDGLTDPSSIFPKPSIPSLDSKIPDVDSSNDITQLKLNEEKLSDIQAQLRKMAEKADEKFSLIENQLNNTSSFVSDMSGKTEAITTTPIKGINMDALDDPKIAIFTPIRTGPLKVETSQNIENKLCYATAHGHDAIFWNSDDTNKPEFKKVPPNNRSLQGHWKKVIGLKRVLSDYDWVLVTDDDYWLNHIDIDIKSWIKTWARLNLNIQMLVPSDLHIDGDWYFSNWAFLIRNSPLMHKMIDKWWSFHINPQLRCDNGYAIKEFYWDRKWVLGDQPFLWASMAIALQETFNFPYTIERDCCQSKTPNLCLNRACKFLNYPKGTNEKVLSKLNSSHPYVFSHFSNNKDLDSGLGLNLNWAGDKFSKERYSSAFGLHIKEPYSSPHVHYFQIMNDTCRNRYQCQGDGLDMTCSNENGDRKRVKTSNNFIGEFPLEHPIQYEWNNERTGGVHPKKRDS